MKNRDRLIILCLAYILGLFTTGSLYYQLVSFPLSIIGSLAILLIYGITACLIQGIRPKIQLICLSCLIGIFAIGYFWLRVPQPQANDISFFAQESPQLVQVTGQVATEPRLTKNNKLRFWLNCSSFQQSAAASQNTSGKLYVTMPLILGNGLQPNNKEM